jgi:hypothetical protein
MVNSYSNTTISVFTLLLGICIGTFHLTKAQNLLVSRYAINDMKFDNLAKSFVTNNGNLVNVVIDQASNTGSLGAAWSFPIGKITRINFYYAHKNTNLLIGNSPFNSTFRQSNSSSSVSTTAQYNSLNVDFAIGGYLGRNQNGFVQLELSPLLFQWGQIINPSSAFQSYQGNNYQLPNSNFSFNQSANYGLRGALTIGILVGEGDQPLFLGPTVGILTTKTITEDSNGSAVFSGDWLTTLEAGISLGVVIK